MCGRFTLATPASKLIELFQLTAFPRMEPRYNIAPSQLVVCIRQLAKTRQAVSMRWGLVPSWAKDTSVGNRMINARSETAAEKPSFRRAFKSQRCLIPVDGFYEWEKLDGRRKQPWLIHMADRQPFAFAGLWESWRPKRTTESHAATEVLSCSVLTTAANEDMAPIHDRMPVTIPAKQFGAWLSDAVTPEQLSELTTPLPPGMLYRYRVSDRVNKPANDDVDCTEEIGQDQQQSLF